MNLFFNENYIKYILLSQWKKIYSKEIFSTHSPLRNIKIIILNSIVFLKTVVLNLMGVGFKVLLKRIRL